MQEINDAIFFQLILSYYTWSKEKKKVFSTHGDI